MHYKIVDRDSYKVIGLQVDLTTSQNKNYEIISSHWKRFNHKLRIKNVKLGINWVKYGVTKKVNNQYIYLTAIPKMIDIEGFEEEELRGGKYIYFEHKGNMDLLKSTIYGIYKKFIPESDFELDQDRTVIHYEQYDNRFLWNKPDSVIGIYVPVLDARLI